jgi:hypothetical protein
MDEKQMLGIVEQFCRQNGAADGEIKVTRVPDWKSVFVEKIGDESDGRAIMMTEYKVDGALYRAGYSTRSQTVYISKAG